MNIFPRTKFVSDNCKPLVTIVIPVYNGADFLADAIQSALDQTYEAIEIIVVNDGSNDGGATECVAQSFGDAIRYFSKPNGGVASALNLAILQMSGDYFSWLSHDDLYSKNKIERQMMALLSSLGSDTIAYSNYSIFSDNPATAIPVHLKEISPIQFRCWLTLESSLHGCTLLIPRTALETCGGFNEALRTTQDYDLWFRLAEKYQFLHIPEVLVQARCHVKQGRSVMATTAFAECDDLYYRFVRKLTVVEIVHMTGLEIGAGYMTIASSMWKRGYAKAGGEASDLARQYRVSTLRVNIKFYSARWQYAVIKVVRRLLTPQVRQKMRSYFQRSQEK